MCKGCDVIVSECGNAVSHRGCRAVFTRLRVFESLARVLVPSQVFLVSVLLPNAMGMRGAVLQFRSPLVVLVMGSVVVASGHALS